MARVEWRGEQFDSRTAAMLAKVAANTPDDLVVTPTQGSYTTATGASAGTHAGGGAVDLSVRLLSHSQRATLVAELRKVGFAAWHRTTAQGFSAAHVHAIAVQPRGQSDRGVLSQAAHAQVKDYYAGRNGLANHGPDDGPRTWVGVTWESYSRGTSQQGFPGTVRRGSHGDAVKKWQSAMIARHYIADTTANHDGIFGPGMESAVTAMQHELGVTVDGIAGIVTWNALVS